MLILHTKLTKRAVINLIDRYGSTADFINKAPSIKLRLASGTEYPVEGRIDAVSGTVDAQTGAVTLRATFANPQHLLRDGGSATVLVPSPSDCWARSSLLGCGDWRAISICRRD